MNRNYNRRDILKTIPLSALGLAVSDAAARGLSQPAANGRPAGLKKPKYVLLLMTDQHRPDALSYTGENPYAVTPHLDALKREGVHFRQAYCQNPVCVPARTSLMLGQSCKTTGVYINQQTAPNDVESLPQMFRRAGYRTACFGKLHVHGRGTRRDWDVCIDPAKGRWGDGAEEYWEGLEPYRVNDNPVLEPSIVSDLPYGLPWPYSKQGTYDWPTKEFAVDYIRTPKDSPWFMQCSFFYPHPPLQPPQKYWDVIASGELEPPDYPADVLDTKNPKIAERNQRRNWQNPTQRQILDAMIGYYGNLKFVDDLIGQVINALKAEGIYDETLILYTADHGEMLWDHRTWHKGVFLDQSVRVPLIVRYPGFAQNRSSEALVELNDVMPTVAEVCGIAPPATAQGKSFMPSCVNPDRPHHKMVFSESSSIVDWPQVFKRERMMFDGRFKYINNGEGVIREVYDHATDPEEMHNIYEQVKNTQRFKDAWQQLEHWAYADRGAIRPTNQWGSIDFVD